MIPSWWILVAALAVWLQHSLALIELYLGLQQVLLEWQLFAVGSELDCWQLVKAVDFGANCADFVSLGMMGSDKLTWSRFDIRFSFSCLCIWQSKSFHNNNLQTEAQVD